MFKEKLKELRKAKGVSQEELSEILDVSRQSISKYENGTAQPSFEKLVAISKYFNVSIDLLLGNSEFSTEKTAALVRNSELNRITIASKIDNKQSSFYKFILSPVMGKKKYHPEIMLMGVDDHSFWGDSAVALAWYETKNDAEKELNKILKAISRGETTYELMYYTSVTKKGWFDFEMT